MLLLLHHSGFHRPTVVSSPQQQLRRRSLAILSCIFCQKPTLLKPWRRMRFNQKTWTLQSECLAVSTSASFGPSHTSQNGYLVSRSPRLFTIECFEVLEASWQLAGGLESKYGSKNFSIGAPVKRHYYSCLAPHMNRNLWSEANNTYTNKTFFHKGSSAFIQKSQMAPEPSLMIGYDSYKRANFLF